MNVARLPVRVGSRCRRALPRDPRPTSRVRLGPVAFYFGFIFWPTLRLSPLHDVAGSILSSFTLLRFYFLGIGAGRVMADSDSELA